MRENCDKLLRLLADSLALEKNGEWEIRRSIDSAPQLYHSGRNSEFDISVSHSGRWVAVGIAKGMAIGVDIQQHQVLRRRREMAEMIGLDRAAANSQQRFFSSWALREAIAKATSGSVLEAHAVEASLAAACGSTSRPVSADQFTAMVELMPPDAHLAVVINQNKGAS